MVFCTDISQCTVSQTLNLKLTVSRIIFWFIPQRPQQPRRTEGEEGSRCGQVETKRLSLYAVHQDKQQILHQIRRWMIRLRLETETFRVKVKSYVVADLIYFVLK